MTLIMRAGALRTVRMFRGRAELEKAHLTDLHARPQLHRQRRHIRQFQRDMPLETRVDEACGGMRENTQAAQRALALQSGGNRRIKLHILPRGPQRELARMQNPRFARSHLELLGQLALILSRIDIRVRMIVEQAEETDERCEALRRDFMLDTNFNDSNKKQELVKFIVAQVAAGASNKKYRFEEIIEHDFENDENTDSYINEHWNNDSGRMLMATAYALSQGIYGSFDYISVNYSDKTVSRKNNPELNKFYALLCKLGYVMSDEEIQLRDGTHPIYTTGEVK